MSFFDKSINGLIIAIVQHFSPIVTQSYDTLKPVQVNVNQDQFQFHNMTSNFQLSNYDNTTISSLKTSEPIHVLYYLHVLVYVSFGAIIITFLALLTILKRKYKKDQKINRINLNHV